MPYPVQNLIEGRGEPICVQPTDSVQKALELMVENDFSQLPVIDDSRIALGMVTYESIVRALNNFGIKVDQLAVKDVIASVPAYRPDEDLFELLDRLRDTYAVLIVDGDDRLIGIVTTYDSTEYFRQRAEDMILVEDIEGLLKDLIRSAFTKSDGGTDEEGLSEAIMRVTSSYSVDKSTYVKALKTYLEQSGQAGSEIMPKALVNSYEQMKVEKKPQDLDDLTLYDFTRLLLDGGRWEFYESILKLDKRAVEKLLDGVRDTRNDLAHFRRDITSLERDRLKFCIEWLDRHQAPVFWPTYSINQMPVPEQSSVVREQRYAYEIEPIRSEIVPTDEELGPRESRYTPLAIWLQSQSGSVSKVQLSFSDIEEIIEGDLPNSARKHRAWWANDTVGHSHSQIWLEAGWRASFVSLAEELVTFTRIVEREKAYIDFFSKLLGLFREAAPFKVKEVSPDGQNWVIIHSLPERGPQLAVLNYSFARNNRFRVELYIDTGDKQENKSVFDDLYSQKSAIEEELNCELSWERIDDKRASRIAIYKAGSISDSEEELTQLREWAVEAMIRFYNAIVKPATTALKKYSERA